MTNTKRYRRDTVLFVTLGIATLLLAVGDMLIGTTHLSLGDIWAVLTGGGDAVARTILLDLRLPKIITAIAIGAALAASGLLMQTLFRNPLAGPYVLGINAGASLGVALFTMALPLLGIASGGIISRLGITGMAWIGSAAILLLMMLLSRRIKSINVILILGMMLSAGISAAVGILQYMGSEESLKSFVVWTMGSLTTITRDDLNILIPTIFVGLMLSIAAIKSLNMLLLGEGYARTMGLRVGLSRTIIFVATTLLAGTVTAFCGPVGFIGLAMPHLARMTFRTADHRVLMPATMLWGALAMLLCCLATDLVARSSGIMLPINSITSLLGIPIIIIVVFRNRNHQ
jgi:iron complex transport system permease protein